MTGRMPRWPLFLIGAPAGVAVWSGWVGLGGLCGFGQVHPLPGILPHVVINTAITLPVGVEAYGAYALGAWLRADAPDAARKFARGSAIGSLCLGAFGQVIYHLLAAAHATRAPWPVVTLVSVLPVAALTLGAALAHLLTRTDPAPAAAPAEARTDPAPVPAVPDGAGPLALSPDPGARTELPASRAEPPAAPRTAPAVPEPAPPRAAPARRYAVPSGPLADALRAAGRNRAAVVEALAAEIAAPPSPDGQWVPDYDALQAATGYGRSWCEKAVREARELAAARTGQAPRTGELVPA